MGDVYYGHRISSNGSASGGRENYGVGDKWFPVEGRTTAKCGEVTGLLIFNIHLAENCGTDNISVLNKILEITAAHPEWPAILGGDFKFPAIGDTRVRPGDPARLDPDSVLSEFFSDKFCSWTELHQNEFTHRTLQMGNITCLGRLGRWYIRTEAADLLDRKPQCYTLQRVSDMKNISNHVLAKATLSAPLLHPPKTRSIPSWVSRHALFTEHCESLYSLIDWPTNPLECLSSITDIFHAAARHVKHFSVTHGATCPESSLYWALSLSLFRAGRSQDDAGVRRALQALPTVIEDCGGI